MAPPIFTRSSQALQAKQDAQFAQSKPPLGIQRACTYKDFINCKPRTFYGNEGVVGLTRWIEKT